jgi:hypothetical protein
MSGVHDLGMDAHGFQGCIGALPVNTGTLHDDLVGRERRGPLGERPPVTPKCAELPLLGARRAIGLLHRCARA